RRLGVRVQSLVRPAVDIEVDLRSRLRHLPPNGGGPAVRNGRARSLRPGLLAASILLLMPAGACSSGSPAQSGRSASTTSPAATLPPVPVVPSASNPLTPPSTPTPGPAVASDLLLTGALSGRVQNAQSLGLCGPG